MDGAYTTDARSKIDSMWGRWNGLYAEFHIDEFERRVGGRGVIVTGASDEFGIFWGGGVGDGGLSKLVAR